MIAQADVAELDRRRPPHSGSDDLAAVDVEDLSGYPLRLIRQQEQAHADQVVGLRPCATAEFS